MDLDPNRIVDLVVAKLLERYERALPLLPGAVGVVRRIARRWPLALASSANRVVIDRVLALADLEAAFSATVSSEEVARGKPYPDVYLEATRRLGQPPGACVAVEDSANGIRSAADAGLCVVAIPDPPSVPSPEVLALARVVLGGLTDLTTETIERAAWEDPS